MARLRFCDSCGARLPMGASARRRYCDDACRAQVYRDRQVADRIWRLGMMLAEAESAALPDGTALAGVSHDSSA
ncbi:hypothetical protein [Streptomyces sp. NPDC004728]|uniref:hypothetical protein n=1 Tax=Streptomyces sp. NPDC004728 TaxID=3154289 RepID=UPI0033BAAA12